MVLIFPYTILSLPSSYPLVLHRTNSGTVIGSEATLTLTSRNGRTDTLRMSGNWRDSRAAIVHVESGATVARCEDD